MWYCYYTRGWRSRNSLGPALVNLNPFESHLEFIHSRWKYEKKRKECDITLFVQQQKHSFLRLCIHRMVVLLKTRKKKLKIYCIVKEPLKLAGFHKHGSKTLSTVFQGSFQELSYRMEIFLSTHTFNRHTIYINSTKNSRF